jgi:hypothetical protein
MSGKNFKAGIDSLPPPDNQFHDETDAHRDLEV